MLSPERLALAAPKFLLDVRIVEKLYISLKLGKCGVFIQTWTKRKKVLEQGYMKSDRMEWEKGDQYRDS